MLKLQVIKTWSVLVFMCDQTDSTFRSSVVDFCAQRVVLSAGPNGGAHGGMTGGLAAIHGGVLNSAVTESDQPGESAFQRLLEAVVDTCARWDAHRIYLKIDCVTCI